MSDRACCRAVTSTFDGVGLGELSTVLEQGFGNRGPAVTSLQPQVHVGTREIVDVKLEA